MDTGLEFAEWATAIVGLLIIAIVLIAISTRIGNRLKRIERLLERDSRL